MLSNGLALLAALILYSPFPKVSGLLTDQASVRIPRGFILLFFLNAHLHGSDFSFELPSSLIVSD